MPPATATLMLPAFARQISAKPGASSNSLNKVFTPLIALKRVVRSVRSSVRRSRGSVMSTLLPPHRTNVNRFAVSAKM
jgi:hypothetical protein